MKHKQVLSNAVFAIFCMAGAVSAWALSSTSTGPKDRKPAAASQRASKSSDTATYVGCLRTENDGKKYVLTEVGGPDAPKSRSWKTAFVTKKASKLEVVAPGLRLRDQVGQTVQVTGRRSEKVIRAEKIRVVGSTCS